MSRYFLAVDLDEGARSAALQLCHGLPGVRWIEAEQMHITLKFLGDLDEAQADELSERLQRIVMPAFQLRLRGVGCFRRKGPGATLWAGIEQNGALLGLQRAVERCCRAPGLPVERGGFNPHLTLARLKQVSDQRLQEYLNEFSAFASDPFPIEEFGLFASELRPEGARHTLIQSFPLQGEVRDA